MGLLDQAILFAVDRHGDMMRKGERKPYILHPLEAAVIVGSMIGDEEVLAAAVLHDTVEDTGATFQEIAAHFGPRVAQLVASETEDKRPALPPEQSWRIRKEESLEKLRCADDPAVKMLWLGDKLSNLRSLYRMWKVRGNEVWNSFHQSDPAQQAWYYRSIDALLGELRDYEAWQEFHALVETVFGGMD